MLYSPRGGGSWRKEEEEEVTHFHSPLFSSFLCYGCIPGRKEIVESKIKEPMLCSGLGCSRGLYDEEDSERVVVVL